MLLALPLSLCHPRLLPQKVPVLALPMGGDMLLLLLAKFATIATIVIVANAIASVNATASAIASAIANRYETGLNKCCCLCHLYLCPLHWFPIANGASSDLDLSSL